MKLQRNISRTAGVLAVLVVMALPGAAGGQPTQQQQQPQQQQPPPQRQRPEQPALPVIDLSFPGGTVIDYVAALRKANPEANIVVDPEAAQIPMPPMTLRRVTVPAALEVLKGRSLVDGVALVHLDVAHVPAFSPEERPTYQVQARMGGRAQLTGSSRSTKVWTVFSLLSADLTSRKLLSAVETALEVVGSEPKPDVRFHEDTGLVIARGSDDQIAAIADVIDQLSKSLKERQGEQIVTLQRMLNECNQRLKVPPASRPAPDAEEPKPGGQRPGGN